MPLDEFLGKLLQFKGPEAALAEAKNSKYYGHYLTSKHSGYLALRFLKNETVSLL